MVCFIVMFPLLAFKKIYTINDHHLNYTNSRNSAHAYLEKNLKGLPILIIPNYFGSATKEYSLWFASKWVGRNAGEYIDDMNKECPDSYFFIPEEQKYYNWRNEISLFDILKSHHVLNLYISLDATKRKEEAFGKEILKKINVYNSPNDSIIKINYLFHQKYDMICQLTIDTARLVKTYHFNDAFCDMERISTDEKYYLTYTSSTLFKNHHLRSSENPSQVSFLKNSQKKRCMELVVPLIMFKSATILKQQFGNTQVTMIIYYSALQKIQMIYMWPVIRSLKKKMDGKN